MSKAHRGKGIRATANRGRGVCPICKRTGIKVVYEVNKVFVCKICRKKAVAQSKGPEAAPAPQEEAPKATD